MIEAIPLDKVGLTLFGPEVDLRKYSAFHEMRDGDYHLSVSDGNRTLYSVISKAALSALGRPHGVIREFRTRLEELIADFERFNAAQKYAQPRGGFKFRPARRRVRLTLVRPQVARKSYYDNRKLARNLRNVHVRLLRADGDAEVLRNSCQRAQGRARVGEASTKEH